MIDVSIIIASHNRLWSLPKAIESCRGTNACRTEIIVVDDGSTDGTWAYLQQQEDVTAVRSEQWGKGWAVQKAMAIAKGEYVRFLDSDDWLKPAANDEQFALARQTGADVVVAGYEDYYDWSGRTVTHPWVECDDFLAQQLGEVPFSSYCAFLFRRAFIQQIPHRQEFALRDDRMFILEVAIAHPRLAVYRSPAFVYRHHRNGRLVRTAGFDRARAADTDIRVIRQALRLAEQSDGVSMRRRKAAVAYLWPAVRTMAHEDVEEAHQTLEWLYELDPSFDPPISGKLKLLYDFLGFKNAERLIRVWRLWRASPPGFGS
jgi:glycosyltransferase involved in cell wall biosynthesis